MNVRVNSNLELEVNPKIVRSWEFVELLGAIYKASDIEAIATVSKGLELLCGKEGKKKIIDSTRDEDGISSFQDVVNTFNNILDIISNDNELKK